MENAGVVVYFYSEKWRNYSHYHIRIAMTPSTSTFFFPRDADIRRKGEVSTIVTWLAVRLYVCQRPQGIRVYQGNSPRFCVPLLGGLAHVATGRRVRRASRTRIVVGRAIVIGIVVGTVVVRVFLCAVRENTTG